MRPTKTETEAARNELRGLLRPGDTVYATVLHESRGHMAHVIRLRTIMPAGGDPSGVAIRDITGLAAAALGWEMRSVSGTCGVVAIGYRTGWEMCIYTVHMLAVALWADCAENLREQVGVTRQWNNYGPLLSQDAAYWLEPRQL